MLTICFFLGYTFIQKLYHEHFYKAENSYC